MTATIDTLSSRTSDYLKTIDPHLKEYLRSLTESRVQSMHDRTLAELKPVGLFHIPRAAYNPTVRCPNCGRRHQNPSYIKAGMLDTLAVFPGHLIWTELKKEGGSTTPEQRAILDALGDNPRLLVTKQRPLTLRPYFDTLTDLFLKGWKS